MEPLCVCGGVFVCPYVCAVYGRREGGQSGELQCSRTAFLSGGNFP